MRRTESLTNSLSKKVLCRIVLLLSLIVTCFPPLAGQSRPLTKFVDPFIGTAPGGDRFGFNGNTGDVFPGAVVPRGMLQWSPDTPSPLPGGYYYPDSAIKGFSVRHFSGRGCVAWQDFAFMPHIGAINTPPAKSNGFYGVTFEHKNESASPGFYSVRLDNRVTAEFTVTRRTGMGRFTFPRVKDATMLVNAGSSARGASEKTSITIVGKNKIQGYATARVGCGKELYTIYMVARFDRPFRKTAVWKDSSIDARALTSDGPNVGAILTFDATKNRIVKAKVGISFVSIENAEANLSAEDPGWNFEGIKAAANQAWNRVLNKIIVDGGTRSQKRTFYTALYHCFFHPNVFSDVNGEYRGMDGGVHRTAEGRLQYENIPGWDIYRSATALTALLAPDEESDVMQSLINDAQQGGGGLPRWEQANRNSGGMVGDGSVIMLATAYSYGATHFNTTDALTAMDLNAGKVGTTSDGNLVRKELAEYVQLGYVPGSASITLEYASADFALSQYAKAMGDTARYVQYLERSRTWKKLFNTANGLIQPRNPDGSWVSEVGPSTTAGYTEGSAGQYVWLVPFDMGGLIDLMGGDSVAVRRLDEYFTKINDGPRSQYAFMGNEPCEGNPWAYSFAGASSKTQDVVRRIQIELFKDSPNGLPGNDDAGALSSWYVFSALGLYPAIPGVGGFALNSPLFERATIRFGNGKTITVQCNKNPALNHYIQGMSVDGSSMTQAWLPFNLLRNGAKLDFKLGPDPSSWGSVPPPSFGGILSERVEPKGIPMEKLEVPTSVPGKVSAHEVLAGIVQGVKTDYITVVGPGKYTEQDHAGSEVIWLFIGGSGSITTRGQSFNIKDETVAYAPQDWLWDIQVPESETLLAVRITKQLTADDVDDLRGPLYLKNNTGPYVKKFVDCIPYGEAIKSAKTISRTLLPEYVVPRLSIGTVETTGPDKVGRHKHAMLEQFFLGLKTNNSYVSADDARIAFPPLSILHIPLGSMHGAEVTDGNKLYYVWMDFFTSREGQEWLKNHKPVSEQPSQEHK
jgi:predicted alpha-1,2-mannosidase